MQIKSSRYIFTLLIMAAASGSTYAQSSIQCTIGPNGTLEAALVWRNTLGTDRANAICRAGAPTAPVAADADLNHNSDYAAMNATALSSAAYQPIVAARPAPEEEFVPLSYR